MGCNSSSDETTKPKKKLSSKLTIFTRSDLVGERTTNINEDYIFKNLLGSGGFGEVRLGVHKITKNERAIKIIGTYDMSEADKKNLLNEIEILRSLVFFINQTHPNILSIFEFFINQNHIYVVTEYLTGGELFVRIMENQNFSELKASKIIREILLAINYLHKNSIVHRFSFLFRDLKPENILFTSPDENSSLKLIDFGTSAIISKKGLKEKVGTCYYVAPEVLLTTSYNEKCDVWSIGVILYVLLCGYPPFNGKSDAIILAKVQKGDYRFPPEEWDNISEEAKELIKHMIDTSVYSRYSAEDCLKSSWFKNNVDSNSKPEETSLKNCIKNLRSFKADYQLQSAFWMTITSVFQLKEEEAKLKKIFLSMDKNGDGFISRQEFSESYSEIFGAVKSQQMSEMLNNIDLDGDGKINYNGKLSLSRVYGWLH